MFEPDALSNPEIEQMLLGRMLDSEPERLIDLDFTEDDFSVPIHWRFYQEIMGGKRLHDYSGRKEFDYLRSLLQISIGKIIPGGDGYSDVLKELGRKRKAIGLINEIVSGYQEMSSMDIYGKLDALVKGGADDCRLKTRKQIIEDISASLDRPKECYPTQFDKLNGMMGGGLYKGYTYGICGPEKAGKTTMGHCISHRMPCKHLYIAMEMGAAQIEQRNIAKELKINSLRFIDNIDGLKNKVDTVNVPDNIIYYDAPGATLDEILTIIGTARIKYDISGYILDYWQLVGGQQRGESEERHLRNVAQSLANYGRKHGLWCLILAQMNKTGELFGGNGLRKACDQLYMLNLCEGHDTWRWMKLDASRYTPIGSIGNETLPGYILEQKQGPYFVET